MREHFAAHLGFDLDRRVALGALESQASTTSPIQATDLHGTPLDAEAAGGAGGRADAQARGHGGRGGVERMPFLLQVMPARSSAASAIACR